MEWSAVGEVATERMRLADSVEEVAKSLSQVSWPSYCLVHLAVLARRRPLIPELTRGAEVESGFSVTAASSREALLTISDRSRSAESLQPISVRISEDADSPLVEIVAVGSSRQWSELVGRLFRWLYPAAYRPFLRQWELQKMFHELQSDLPAGESIRLTRVSSLRRMLHEKTRRQFESELVWTDVDYLEAFESAERDSQYFRTVQFDVCQEHQTTGRPQSIGVSGVVSRNGHLAANRRLGWVRSSGLKVARERALEDFKLAGGRSRNVGAELPSAPKPLVVEFRDDVSIEIEDLPHIVAVLRRMSATSVSILHGNPYLRAAIVDARDGSAFDLVLTSNRRLLLIPQLRATESAVMRLCRFIYDQIGEAEFVEANLAG